MYARLFSHKPCEWWGWWLRYPIYNLGRIYRNWVWSK